MLSCRTANDSAQSPASSFMSPACTTFSRTHGAVPEPTAVGRPHQRDPVRHGPPATANRSDPAEAQKKMEPLPPAQIVIWSDCLTKEGTKSGGAARPGTDRHSIWTERFMLRRRLVRDLYAATSVPRDGDKGGADGGCKPDSGAQHHKKHLSPNGITIGATSAAMGSSGQTSTLAAEVWRLLDALDADE